MLYAIEIANVDAIFVKIMHASLPDLNKEITIFITNMLKYYITA